MQKIKLFKISELKEDKENPNEMSKEKLEALKLAIEQFGELQPILATADNIIIDGHHRVKAYKDLGKKEIPGYEITATDHQRRLIRQTMNKIRGEHNEVKDAQEIQKILQEMGSIEDLSNLIGESEDSILKLMDALKREDEKITVEFQAKTNKTTSWTFVALQDKDIETINKALNKTGEKNSSIAFLKICEAYLK